MRAECRKKRPDADCFGADCLRYCRGGVAGAVSAGRERFRPVGCGLPDGAIFLGRIPPDGAGGGGIPPYDGRPGREDERIPVRICPSPRRICKKIHAICQKTRGYTKKMETKLHIPPIKGMGCEIYRFPKTKMTYEKSRCGSKLTSFLLLGLGPSASRPSGQI